MIDALADEGLVLDLVRGMFPPSVGVGFSCSPTKDDLFPEEAAELGPRTAPRRRSSFRLGRLAAHRALAELGALDAPIGRAADRSPVWPAHVVGAITHAADMGLAVVGWQRDFRGLGVDVEMQHPRLRDRAIEFFCRPEELAWVRAVAPEATTRALMLFSAKESIFKALYPIERVWLGFQDAALAWDGQTFQATVLKAAGADIPAGYLLSVRAAILQGRILTATWV